MLRLFTYIFIQNWDGGAPEKSTSKEMAEHFWQFKSCPGFKI